MSSAQFQSKNLVDRESCSQVLMSFQVIDDASILRRDSVSKQEMFLEVIFHF